MKEQQHFSWITMRNLQLVRSTSYSMLQLATQYWKIARLTSGLTVKCPVIDGLTAKLMKCHQAKAQKPCYFEL